MSDTVQTWLVERGYNSRDLITLKYATPDGSRVFRKELAAQAMDSVDVTAAREVSTDDLERIENEDTREVYATEVDRVKGDHSPDDEL